MTVDWGKVTEEDKERFATLIGSVSREPDLTITGDTQEPYLYRWWVLPHSREVNVYAHLQVASDPARPLHDHPWDNMSVILSGGYTEKLCHFPQDRDGAVRAYDRKKGDTIFRKAEWAHRLILPASIPYTMTLFSTGPKVHSWGFWINSKHVPFDTLTTLTDDGRSIWHGPELEEDDAPHTV